MIYLGASSIISSGVAVLDTRLGDLVSVDLAGLCLDRFLTGGVVRGSLRVGGTLAGDSTSTAIATVNNCLKFNSS